MNVKCRWWQVLVVAMVVAGLLVQCTAEPTPTPTQQPVTAETPQPEPAPTEVPEPAAPAEGGTLTVALFEDPTSLDPHYAWINSGTAVFTSICDPYITFDEGAIYRPALLESWEVSDDNLTYTLHLRQGIVFSDGEPWNAEAAKVNLDRVHEAWGWTNYTVTVLDDYTVEVVQDVAYSNYLGVLASWDAFPLSPKALAEYGDEISHHPVGTGPFMLEEWVSGDHITLVRNPKHVTVRSYVENPGPPYLDEVVFRIMPEPATRIAALEAGEIQVVFNPVPHETKRLEEAGFGVESVRGGINLEFLELNSSKPPFTDLRVRQAFMYALNIDEVIDTIWEGYADRACGMVPVGATGYDPRIEADCFSRDPDRAATLLEEAGWIDSDGDGIREKDGESLSVTMVTGPEVAEADEAMVAPLADVGFDVDLQVIDFPTINAMMMEHELDAHIAHNKANYFDADTIWWLTSEFGQGLTPYTWAESPEREEFQRLVDEGQAIVDLETRQQLYYDAQRIVTYDLSLTVPLYTIRNVMVTSPNVSGLRMDPIGAANTGIYEDVTLTE